MPVQWYWVQWFRCAITTTIELQDSFSCCKTETLKLLNNNTPWAPPPSPWQPLFSCYCVWLSKKKKKNSTGVPTVAQWERQCLWSTKTQVRSQAWHSGLRLWCFCSWGLDLTPYLGISICCGVAKKEKKSFSCKWQHAIFAFMCLAYFA